MKMEFLTMSPQEVQGEYGSYENVGEFIHKIETQLKVSGRLLCAIEVNGLKLSESDEQKFSSIRAAEVKSVRIGTSDIEQIIISTLVSMHDYIGNLKNYSLDVANELRGGDDEHVRGAVTTIIDSSEWIVETLKHLRLNLTLGDELALAWLEAESDFLLVSQELFEAFKKSDFVRYADALEYDWTNALDKWLNLLSALDSQMPGVIRVPDNSAQIGSES